MMWVDDSRLPASCMSQFKRLVNLMFNCGVLLSPNQNRFSVPPLKTPARRIQHSMRILLALALPLAVRRTAARPCMCHVVACMLGCTPHSWRILLALARLVPVRTTAAFATAQANGGQVASCNGPSRNPQSTRARTNARQVACWNAQGPQKRGPKMGATKRYQSRAKITSDNTLRHSKN